MSNHIISTIYGRTVGSPHRKAVMILFADKASDNGEGIYASKVAMAEELEMTRRGLINIIQGLEDDGLIETIRTRQNGVVEYSIKMDAVYALPLNQAGARRAARGVNPIHTLAPQGVNPIHTPCEPHSHKPLLNHSPSESLPKPKKSSSIPDDFQPELTEASRKIVSRWPSGMLEREVDKFRNHHTAKGSKMKDWQAAFRTWISNADEWRGGRQQAAPSQTSYMDYLMENRGR